MVSPCLSIGRRSLALGGLAATLTAPLRAQTPKPLRIGVLTDMNGGYADQAGPGSVEAARMAAEDFGGSAAGRPVEILFADHQNKPDVAAALARAW